MKKLVSASLLALTFMTSVAYAHEYKASVKVDVPGKNIVLAHVYNAHGTLLASLDGNQSLLVTSDTRYIYIGATPNGSNATPMDPHYAGVCYDTQIGKGFSVVYPDNFNQEAPPSCPKP